jgi:transcriptional regulator with XRE-family HTH domain
MSPSLGGEKTVKPKKAAPSLKVRNKGFGTRVREARLRVKMTQDTLAKHLNYSTRSTVAQWERFKNVPDTPTIERVAQLLSVLPEWLAYGVTDEPKIVAPNPQQLGYVLVPEIQFGDAPTDTHTNQTWGLPFEWLRGEMHVADVGNLAIVQVDTPCSPFEFGDRIIVDRNSTKVSPPGPFMIWDGVGAVVAHVSVVPGGKKPTARVKTDQDTYESEIDKLTVLGRVRGVWKKA